MEQLYSVYQGERLSKPGCKNCYPWFTTATHTAPRFSNHLSEFFISAIKTLCLQMQQTLHSTLMQKTHKNLAQVCVNLWPGPPLAFFCDFLVSSQLSCGERQLVEKSDEAIGMDIDSCVVENEVWLELSFSRPGQASRFFGHSSRKGRRDCPSCLTDSLVVKSLLKNECWGWLFCNIEFSVDFSVVNDETLDCIKDHALSSCESIWRPLLLPEASDKKLCSPPSGLSPWRYL